MRIPYRYVLYQGPVLGALLSAATSGLKKTPTTAVTAPTPWVTATLPPPPAPLVRDYMRWLGAEAQWNPQVIPPHLFPQWAFPILSKTLTGLPYRLDKLLNAGASLTIHGPLPSDTPMEVRARLGSIDDGPRRVLLTQELEVGPIGGPVAFSAQVRAILPRRAPKDPNAPKKAKPTVPNGAEEIARLRFHKRSGLEFALLTGDFNPIHWIGPVAKLSGQKNVIIHGFATFASAWERLGLSHEASGTSMDVRFLRPVVLPADTGLYTSNNDVFVGDRPEALAAMTGTFTRGDN